MEKDADIVAESIKQNEPQKEILNNKMINKIKLTDKAIKQLKKENKLLRIGVKGAGGCKGYSFVFAYEDNKKDNDLEYQFDEVKIIIDPKSSTILGDFTLDYHKSLIKSEFKLIGEQIKSTCGCGKSFSIK